MLRLHISKRRYIYLLLLTIIVGGLTFTFQPTAPQVAEAAGTVRITGIVDGDLSGGTPKAIELYVEGTVDLSTWTLYRSSNGGAFSQVGTLSGSYTDAFVYLIGSGNNGVNQFDAVFGTSGDFANRALISNQINGNGNDGFQIRDGNDVVIDQVWQQDPTDIYRDSYMYRNDCTGPDGGWNPSNWTIPGNGVLDGLDAAGHAANVPFGTWSCVTTPVINEFNISHDGVDDAEFVEIFFTPNTSLSTYTLLEIEGDQGNTGVIDQAELIGTTDANGFWGTGYLTNAFENGTITLLLVENFTGVYGTDLDTNDDGIFDSTPWTSIVDSVAISDGGPSDVVYSTVVLTPGLDGITFSYGGASRIPNGIDTDTTADWVRQDFGTSGQPGEGAPDSVSVATRIEAVNTHLAVNTLGTADAAPLVISTSPANGDTGVAVDSNIVIQFNEPVSFTTASATITCNATNISFTVSGTQTVTIDPSVNFNNSDNCTVTLLSANITDIDLPSSLTLDGDGDGTPETPDNYVFSFQVTGPVAPTRIYDLQENGSLFGNAGPFTVEGVVTNDLQSTLNGFYMQDATGDGNPLTSDGIFVYDPSTLLDVNVGDIVQVTGTVSEAFGQTQISATNIVDSGNDGSIAPTFVELPIADVNDWENYEGMLITVTGQSGGELTVSDVFNLGRFGEITVSSGRLFNPTNVYLPGSSQETALRDQNARNRLLVDDLSDGTLDVNTPGNVPYIPTTSSEFRNGFTTPQVTGTLGYGFSNYRLRPTTTPVWTNANPRTPAPTINGQLTVASFNVENWFNGDGAGGGFPTPRGADTLQEFNRQAAKIVATICQINADVAGLVELENEADAGNISAIETLVDLLNAESGCGPYTFIETGTIGADAIKVGIIYKPAVVTPVGNFEILTEADDPRFDTTRNRPALAQTFDDNFGGRFTLVVNHFKSKGSACGAPDDDPIQGNCNTTRTNAAEALVDWLATDPTGSGDPDFLIVGDLNAYAQEDPIRAIEEGADDVAGNGDDYTDLIEAFIGPGNIAYSYTFFGEAGYLDHAIASSALLGQVSDVAEWHINSDEPNQRGYDDNIQTSGESSSEVYPAYLYEPNAYRSSDHDPLVIGLNLRHESESDNATVFRIGDWVETPFAVASGGTALCSTSPLATLAVPFDGTTISVTHITQPGGGQYNLEIPGGIGASPIDTNGSLGVDTRTGSTTNLYRNYARIEVLNGLVCIDTIDAAYNPAGTLPNGYLVSTTTGQPSGTTEARASCNHITARVVTLFENVATSTQYEISAVFISNNEVMASLRLGNLITPPFLASLRFSLNYFVSPFDPIVPGYPRSPNAGNPLDPNDTEVLVQLRNPANGACRSVSYEYACGTGTATLTQNMDTCIFPQ